MHSRLGWMFCGRVMAGNPRLMFFKNACLSHHLPEAGSPHVCPWNCSHSAHNRLTSSLHDHTMSWAWLFLFFFFFNPVWCICKLLGGLLFPCSLGCLLSEPRLHSFPTSSLFAQEREHLGTTFIECIIWLYPSSICNLSACGLYTRNKTQFKAPVEAIFTQSLEFVVLISLKILIVFLF